MITTAIKILAVIVGASALLTIYFDLRWFEKGLFGEDGKKSGRLSIAYNFPKRPMRALKIAAVIFIFLLIDSIW